jgi:hypothetical protein
VALAAALISSITAEKTYARQTSPPASFAVNVVVLPYARYDVPRQAKTLTITQADVKRGYVDVSGATHLHVQSNVRGDVFLNFHLVAAVFDKVKITGLIGTVELGSTGGTMRQPNVMPQMELYLSYRFFLVPGVRPGDHPWPLALSVSIAR